MNQPRYTRSTVSAAVTSPVIARLAFVLLLVVAGSEHSFADIDNDAIASGFYAGNQVDSNIASASVPVVPGAPALVITKVATPDTNVTAGTLVTYTYTVRNSGNQMPS